MYVSGETYFWLNHGYSLIRYAINNYSNVPWKDIIIRYFMAVHGGVVETFQSDREKIINQTHNIMDNMFKKMSSPTAIIAAMSCL